MLNPSVFHRSYLNALRSLAPTAYWPMTELSGTKMVCPTTTAIATGDCTYTNSPTLGAPGLLSGDPQSAVTFDGTTQYATVASSSIINYADTFTLLAWISRGATGASRGIISRSGNTGYMRVSSTGTLDLVKSGVAVIATSVAVIPTGPCMVAVTKNAGDVHLYVQGAESTGTVTNQTCIAGGALIVGGDTTVSQLNNGTIGWASLWVGTGLPAAAIAMLCQVGRGF